MSAAHGRVRGLEVGGPGGRLELSGELVIDATGRSAMGLPWLRKLGLELPAVEVRRRRDALPHCACR